MASSSPQTVEVIERPVESEKPAPAHPVSRQPETKPSKYVTVKVMSSVPS